MAITTKEEIKILLSIAESDVSKDALISSLILKVQDFILRRINNFIVPDFYYEGYGLSFHSEDKTIRDASNGFLHSGFISGNEIQVSGSLQNNKVLTVVSIEDDRLSVSETVNDEDAGIRITIRKIEFTEDIKLAVADFIAFKLNKASALKSRSLGDHSESYLSYEEMLMVFEPFRKLEWS